MPITYLDEKPKSKVTYLNSESPNRGERSLIGNIFERPQKAIGGGIISQMTGGLSGKDISGVQHYQKKYLLLKV